MGAFILVIMITMGPGEDLKSFEMRFNKHLVLNVSRIRKHINYLFHFLLSPSKHGATLSSVINQRCKRQESQYSLKQYQIEISELLP